MSSVFEDGLVYGRLLAFAMLALIFSPVYTSAQDNYEIQVYGYDLVDPGHTMVELHSNFTIDGSKETSDGVYPTNHAEHETVEITHGFNDWFECGFTSSLRSPKARAGSGWAITSGRASPFRRNGTGLSVSVSRMKSATRGGNTPRIRGRGKSAPSWTSKSADGIGP